MRLLWISAATFILLVVNLFGFPKNPPVYVQNSSQDKVLDVKTQVLPVIAPDSTFPLLSAQAVLAMDLETGTMLYEKNSSSPFLPASTTKIVTALTAMDFYPPDLVLEVGKVSVEGQKMRLVEGEKLRVIDLLYGLLIFSANDAAEVLAANFPGGRDFFVTSMNLQAKKYGLNNSYFTNPSGLDGPLQVTTATDLARISEIAMLNPTFAKIVGTKQVTLTSVDGKNSHPLTNINELIGNVDGVLGVKTGWTEEARENLVTYLERDGKKIMIVVLGSQDRFGETKELIDWIFANYEWKEVSFSQG
jgi:D-alanyl-D-alanine carboxypeptidase (penicillin-binding protein 5/6)